MNALQILVPMGVFTLIVVALASVVLAVRRRLVAAVEVPLTINGQPTYTATTGEKLLWQLANQGIYLPAACGGRGACGQCKVTATAGAGPILPTETGHLRLDEIQHGMRLACMITVREPLSIKLSEALLDARRWSATVRATRHLSTFLKEFTLEFPEPINFSAGDYVLVEAPASHIAFANFSVDEQYQEEWQRLGLFDLHANIDAPTQRAYSFANPPTQASTAVLVVRIATPPPHAPPETPPGQVSSYLFSLSPGDQITMIGPHGSFHAQDSEREMVFIAGGAGVAPMRSMILAELQDKGTQRPVSFWYGARNVRELCYREEFEALARTHDNFRYHVSLSAPRPEDDWQGPTGLIHNVVLDSYLRDHPRPEEAEYYLCGPPLMAAAVLAMLDDLGVDRQSVYLDDFAG